MLITLRWRLHRCSSQDKKMTMKITRSLRWIQHVLDVWPSVQDMYTRLLSANLEHVFCWAPGECRDSRVFHVDRVFLRLW